MWDPIYYFWRRKNRKKSGMKRNRRRIKDKLNPNVKYRPSITRLSTQFTFIIVHRHKEIWDKDRSFYVCFFTPQGSSIFRIWNLNERRTTKEKKFLLYGTTVALLFFGSVSTGISTPFRWYLCDNSWIWSTRGCTSRPNMRNSVAEPAIRSST